MRLRAYSVLLAAALIAGITHQAAAQNIPASPVTIEGDHFVRNGKPYQILSGAIHYARVPRAYWRDRLQKARAMGLNTVETYVFWNLHEPQPGVFDFTGQNDIAAFVRIAQQEGLNVIVRPGPYVCAEWEAGGYPAWLFANPNIKVRTKDPKFLALADRYLARVGKELAPLQATHGGPIIAVQIENEYGSFGSDREYMEDIHQSLIRAGLGDSLFYTSDGVDELHNDAMPGILAVINFGPGEAKGEFAKLIKLRPDGPKMTGEYWDGWFDAWGDKQHVHTDSQQQANEIDWMLSQGYSFNLYMFHGGTSFGFMNGANLQADADGHYAPQTTSYDYDAALDEGGRPTKKFFLLRDIIQKHTGITPPPLPAPLPIAAVPEFQLKESASLWSNLPTSIESANPNPMESFGQAYGYILYRTELTQPKSGELKIDEPRDYAAVYINQKLVGTLDHRLKQTTLNLNLPSGHATLDILVENTGRVNYGPHLSDGRAGIVGSVTLAGQPLTGWKIFPLPMSDSGSIQHWSDTSVPGPAFHRGSFSLTTIADTYLDTSKLGKGFVWGNGHNLGRVWDIGPQKSLYLPAPWLKSGTNEVVVFDFTSLDNPALRGSPDPVWSQTAKE
ncbi:glycoside hydrolase family 35 protein [Acidicapsa ligni]|uniref:glycoside hydrolase family 35 protein n=1 Tax=Acidicapsa ligni TaxID=542300 RepID=UPI0021E07424|nr:beta-galactosidase family protein [Acidicapsa ligni]